MTFPCKIEWRWPDSSSSQTETVQNTGELRHQLASIQSAANEKQIAVATGVVTSKDNAFVIVLSLPYGSILTFNGGPGRDPPYFVSVGDDEKDDFVHFSYGGSPSELPSGFVISEELALDALIDLIENEKPSSLIEWLEG